MNTTQLKRFAQEARRKLLEQVAAKLKFVKNNDTSELRGKTHTLNKLKSEINKHGEEAVIDKVAYTWFNRLVALRYMDANGYQPIGMSVVSPATKEQVSPEILTEAHRGNISSELIVDRAEVMNILNGSQPSNNPDNEVYRKLLVSACNHLSNLFPFLFERIDDYTELLLPDDLTSPFSIVKDVYNGMSDEDCKEVEIIGWLYQFYISEWNEELIQSKKAYKKNEIAPASQLFTPKWIVQYMVDNTLGQLWSEIDPKTKVLEDLEFYIKPAYKDQLPEREKVSIEEIKFFDPCAGSGHILSYAFDVFYRIYEEQGYNVSEIPGLIITNNLFGAEIDERAAQLASFVLLMKGREKYRRFFNQIAKNNIQPNIVAFQNFEEDEKFNNASVLGSLIKIEPSEINTGKIDEGSLFAEKQKALKDQYQLLGERYDIVVTNPPYINSSRMEESMKEYINKYYPDTKSDLFATFILRCLELCKPDGLTGYMTPFVWMFISSYEKVRKGIINNHFINNLIQLEYSGYDGATVPICTFTLRNAPIKNAKGSYIRLSDFRGSAIQAPKTLEAIKNPDCGWFYTADQKKFKRIPEWTIGAYWMSNKAIDIFQNSESLGSKYIIRQGMATGNNDRFIRFWSEVGFIKTETNAKSKSDALKSGKRWFPIDKGGGYRKWYGLNQSLVAFDQENYGKLKKMGNKCPSEQYYFYNGLTWGKITSGKFSVRLSKTGSIFSDAGMKIIFNDQYPDLFLLGFLNSKVCPIYLKVFSETLNFEKGTLAKLPIFKGNTTSLESIVEKSINSSNIDWDSRETSWDFKQNELIRFKSATLEESFNNYVNYWNEQFFQLHENEEELNRQFIEIYGLQDELTPDVPLEEITILQEETGIEDGELVFYADKVMEQFVSYAVGCMFGRYSLDKEGLILANQGETLQDYLIKVGKSEEELTFVPDKDNIIPVLDEEWFADDIVERFYSFLKASFGEKNFRENLRFVEESLGKDIRRYFIRDFYNDHIKRYKKRPIYWMFSSPKGHFNVLIYMHRYTPDTVSRILNSYLREFIDKLERQRKHLEHVEFSGSAVDQNRARKEIDKIDIMLNDCKEYEKEILYPLATKRVEIDLDDGVLVNYNKMGSAVAKVAGLNDKDAKKKVRKFDWIDTSEIRD
jgi:hypothetical protein